MANRPGTKYSPENATRNTNQPLGTKLRREAPCVIEVLEDEGSEVHEVLVGVVEP